MPNGFCIYNNVAIGKSFKFIHIYLGAEYLRKKYNTKKICIVDWDIHHGDGTEHLTYNDD
jgi:acetoin utilization deacetylase AcuC-like enzyme